MVSAIGHILSNNNWALALQGETDGCVVNIQVLEAHFLNFKF